MPIFDVFPIPSCPSELSPQQTTCPFSRSAHVWAPPRATADALCPKHTTKQISRVKAHVPTQEMHRKRHRLATKHGLHKLGRLLKLQEWWRLGTCAKIDDLKIISYCAGWTASRRYSATDSKLTVAIFAPANHVGVVAQDAGEIVSCYNKRCSSPWDQSHLRIQIAA